ncbi:MAG TPA: TonB-dependent receptor plug domain-containing protein [Gemmatimonadales bacterium]|nr:TonB-dependent receptor plug domain-containing protein [Gemmatimonadales bacterium]
MAPNCVRALVVLFTVPALLRSQTPDSTPRDSTTRVLRLSAGARLTRAHLDSLPIDRPATAMAQIPGVFVRGPDVGVRAGDSLSIRGGAANGAATFIDGAPVRSFLTGRAFIEPALNGVAGIDVTTGLGGAELSDIQNGIVSYETPTGGDRLAMHWTAHTDNPFGPVASVGYNRFAGDIGGPIPGTTGLTFFAAGYVEGQSSEYLGFGAQDVPTYELGGLDTTVLVNAGGGGVQSVAVPKFVQVSGSCVAAANGASCQGLTRPFDWRTGLRFQGRLRWAYGDGSSLSVTGLADGAQFRDSPGAALGDPALFSGAHEWSRLAVVNWHHRLTSNLAFEAVMSLGSDNSLEGTLDPASETATRDPSMGIELSSLHFSALGPIGFPLSDQIIRDIRTNSGLRVPYQGQTQLSNVQPYRMNPFAMLGGGLYTGGSIAPMSMASEHRRTGRWALQWSRPGHAVTVGIDADGADLTSYQAQSPITELSLDAWTASPSRVGAFAQDVVTLGNAKLEVGARFDRLSPGVLVPNIPGFIFNNPSCSSTVTTQCWDHTLTSTSPDAAYEAAVSKVYTPGRHQIFLTPRARLAWNIDPATTFRAGLGWAVVTPPVSAVATHTNADLTFTGAEQVFGSDVTYGVSTNLDLEIHHEFGRATSLNLGVYDHLNVPTFNFVLRSFDDPTNPGHVLPLNVLARTRDGSVQGVDAGVSQMFGAAVAASLSAGVSSHGFDNVMTILPPPACGVCAATTLLTRTTTTTEALSASVRLAVPRDWASEGWRKVLRDIGAVAEFRMINGVPYTPLLNFGVGTVAPEPNFGFSQPSGAVHSQGLPWTKVLDLRVTKGVRANGLDWTIFADFRNLLNINNVYTQYAETNSTSNPLFQSVVTSSESAALANEAASNGALAAGGSITLTGCGNWSGNTGPVNCFLLRRAEARFGNGDGTYTLAEQQNAMNAYFNMVYGSYRFYGPQRTVRVGLELAL